MTPHRRQAELTSNAPLHRGAGAPLSRRRLRKHYRVFTRRLLGLLTRPGMTTKVRLAALGALMELARAEQQGSFANELYVEAIRALVTGHGLTPEVLGALVGRYLKFADVRFYTYVALGGVAGGVDEAAARDDDDDDDGADDDDGGEMAPALRPSDVARNTYDVLCSVPPDFRDWTADGSNAEGDVEWDPVEAWCREDGVTPPAKKKRKKVGADGKEVQPRWASGSKHRKAFSDAWIAVLRMPFPEDILKSVLVRLHSNVIPHMLNPVLLSDFLTASIDAGGLIGMLALNGLFVLMTQHGLEYPSFYRRLYTLLDATSFHLTRRKRFFELLDIFLKSTLLPAYVGAAFAKKLARLALHAPPAGALVAIAFVHNLVRRHPACAVLLNREKLPASAQGAKGDPFDAEELDPAKCRALESSLWEMATLQNHYCPQVARFVSVLEKDLSKRDKTAELPVSDLASGSYASLVEEEVERRLKSVPLAFYSDAERPQTLFGAPDDAERFGGWSLS